MPISLNYRNEKPALRSNDAPCIVRIGKRLVKLMNLGVHSGFCALIRVVSPLAPHFGCHAFADRLQPMKQAHGGNPLILKVFRDSLVGPLLQTDSSTFFRQAVKKRTLNSQVVA
jgi:hypothetical protein